MVSPMKPHPTRPTFNLGYTHEVNRIMYKTRSITQKDYSDSNELASATAFWQSSVPLLCLPDVAALDESVLDVVTVPVAGVDKWCRRMMNSEI